MLHKQFVGNGIESLVEKLMSTDAGIRFGLDVAKVIEEEKQAAYKQLYRYAEDIQKLLAERDIAVLNKKEKDTAYKQLECFNRDFMKVVEQRKKAHKALETSHLDTLRRLAAAAEYKDDNTGVHIVRMSRFAAIIARAYGQGEEFCILIEQASPMHDIGKIGIPDNVLKKPGKLTKEEWEVMRMHPEYGANILGGSEVLVIQMAEEVARSHHEKYDGVGTH